MVDWPLRIQLFGNGAVALGLMMFLMWIVSVIRSDVSIVDRVWGISFIVLGITYVVLTPQLNWVSVSVFFLVSIWGLRLSIHINRRNAGHPEDYRYQKMRAQEPLSFWWKSLYRVFWLQGALAIVVSLPLLWIFSNRSNAKFGVWEMLGFCVWLVGFLFEAGGDWQLQRFKSELSNHGKLLKTGLWSITRHPNYFGDALQWWGIFLFAMNTPNGWITIVGPITMTLFLRYVSGVGLLEKSLRKTKPGYEQYMANTPAFVPNLHIIDSIRFVCFVLGKIICRSLFRIESRNLAPWPDDAWRDVRITLLLNHTSLLEPVFTGALPIGYLRKLSFDGIFPAADETMNRPLVGALIRTLAPKVGILTRRRDASWSQFLETIGPTDTLIFLPEGRMKRANGLDKYQRPMTARRGIGDVLKQLGSGKMIIAYSGGLHHLRLPHPRRETIAIAFESIRIEDYLREVETTLPGDHTNLGDRIALDLDRRRDNHCN